MQQQEFSRRIILKSQKLRNSSVLYHKAKNPFETKICMKISFQLL